MHYLDYLLFYRISGFTTNRSFAVYKCNLSTHTVNSLALDCTRYSSNQIRQALNIDFTTFLRLDIHNFNCLPDSANPNIQLIIYPINKLFSGFSSTNAHSNWFQVFLPDRVDVCLGWAVVWDPFWLILTEREMWGHSFNQAVDSEARYGHAIWKMRLNSHIRTWKVKGRKKTTPSEMARVN